MAKRRKESAGLLMHRASGRGLEVFLVHPGGPFWAKRDEGSWSVPKGEHAPDEDALAAARREFAEETGTIPVAETFVFLGEARQPGGKIVRVWAFEGDCDPAAIRSNTFDLEWPPGSGRTTSFPEVDRAGWFGPAEARRRLLPGQRIFIDRLDDALAGR